jgi:tripartite-type tricarboxylate transporter receptor subunit TctC
MKTGPKLLVAGTIAALGATTALAQSYPSRPVTIVANSAPGASIDISARVVANWAEKHLRQPFVVENRPGANGNIGANAVLQAKPDGYTLLVASDSLVTTHLVVKDTPYAWQRDFIPIAKIAGSGLVMTVSNAVPVKNLTEFVAYGKANPGKLNQGLSGSVNAVMEEVKSMLGIQVTNVMYKGGAPVTAALASGEVQLGFMGIFQAIPLREQGKVTLVAYTSGRRHPRLPDVPTVAEQGYPGYNGGFFIGLFAPAGTPKDVVDVLNRQVNAMNKDADTLARYDKQGYETYDVTPAAMREELVDIDKRATKVFAAIGVKPQ